MPYVTRSLSGGISSFSGAVRVHADDDVKDIEPSNVGLGMLTSDDDVKHIELSNFGLGMLTEA